MKKSKILAILAAGALTVSMGAFALAGCGGGTDYAFEAEDAILSTGLKLQAGKEWTGTEEEGADVTVVSYFTPGTSITWNITAASECDVTLKLRASSCIYGVVDSNGVFCSMNEMQTPPDGFVWDENVKCKINEIKADELGATLKVNGTESTFKGTLPATSFDFGMGEQMGLMYFTTHCGELEAKVHLKAGENAVVLECVTGGVNVDKITVNSKAELTFTKTDNSGLLGGGM